MLNGIEIKLNCNFFENREALEKIAEKIIFTGPIDQFYNYQFGELEYRSLRFETEILDEKKNKLYEKYRQLANQDKNVIFGGRLGQYKYYDMDKVILEVLDCVSNIKNATF